MQILPERWRPLVPEMTKFATIGGINTIVDLAIYNALLGIGPLKAKAVALVIATALSYLMNRYWTWSSRQRGSAHREYLLFFGLNLVGFVIQAAPIAFAKYGLDFSEVSPALADRVALNAANIVGTFFGMLFRFWSYRTFVFKAAKPEPEPATSDEPTSDEQFTELAAQLAADLQEPADIAEPVTAPGART